MHRRHVLLGGALALATLPGCSTLSGLARRAFQRPRFSFRNARLSEASLAGATMLLTYGVENPNPVGLSLAQVAYAFFVEDKQLVAGSPPRGLKLKANGTSELVFPASFRFADLAPVVQTFLTKDSARYRAQGSVGLQTPIGVLSFPLDHQGTFEVPKVPQVQLASPRISNLGVSGATVEFPLQLTNRNSFPLPIGGLTGALSLAGASVGTLNTGDFGLLQPRASREVRVPLQISFARAAQAAVALRTGRGSVGFDGQVLSGGAGIPLSFNQLVSFVR